MNSGSTSFSGITRQSISLGLFMVGLVLVIAVVSRDNHLQVAWYALPAVALAVGGTALWHEWRILRAWVAERNTVVRQRRQEREDTLGKEAHERALAIVEGKNQGLDYRARAIRAAQISIWVADIPSDQIIFEGIHTGQKDFLPDTRIYHGREWYVRLHPHDTELVEYRFKEFIKRRIHTFEMEYRVPDDRGGWRWMISRGLVIQEDERGRTVVAAGTHTDIHQRKLAQIAYAQERALFNAGPVVIFRFSLIGDRIIDFISRNAARLWRYSDPDWTAVGKPTSALVHPDDLLAVRATINEAFATSKPAVDAQLRLLRGDGTYHWQSMRLIFEMEHGQPFARGYMLDVQERKAVEELAASHNQALEALVEQLHMAQADSVVLQETSDLLNSAEDVDEAFEIVRRAADAVFPGWSGSLSAIMQHGGLSLVGQWGAPPWQDAEFQLKDCWGLRRGKPHGYLNEDRQLRCNHIHPDVEGQLLPYVCVPMSANGETVGALHLFANSMVTSEQIGDIEVRAERFAETLKLAMSNLRLRAWLRDQATRDGLTGLYNRRLLDERLPVEIKRSHRDRLPVSLAMIDVDHFKRFNDDYGHDAGDLVLKSISELLMDRVRVYDLACRYGGEELILLMPGCQIEDAIVKLEAIRIDVASLQISYQGYMLPPVTISIGLAETHGGSAEALLRQADEALYRAKRQGRNRLVVQDDTIPPPEEMH